MSDSLTALYLSNPALATALRRQQSGQQLFNQASDSSPTTALGALARLANAYVGTREIGQGTDAIKAAADAQTADRASFSSDLARALGGGQSPAGTPPAPVPGPQSSSDGSTPLTDRLNNPGALKFAGQPGASNVNGFAAFPSRDAGMAAADANLAGYAGQGVNTLAGAITKWAPPNENNTAAYIQKVAQASGIDPNAQIDLSDPTVRARILPHITAYEGGPNSVAGGGLQSGRSPLVAALAGPPPDAGGGGGAPGGGPQLPPEVAAIPDPMRRAQAIQQLALRAANSLDPTIKAQAPLLMQMAGQQLQVQRTVEQNRNGALGSYNTMTGEFKPYFTGSGRFGSDASGNTLYAAPGGGPPQVAATNRTGITGTSPEANAMRAYPTIAGKLSRGEPLSPEETALIPLLRNVLSAPQVVTSQPSAQTSVVPRNEVPALPSAPAGASGPGVPPASSPPTSGAPRQAVAPNPTAVAANASAAAQGTEAGKAAGDLPKQLSTMGQEAERGIGNIDTAQSHLDKALQGGLPGGKFLPPIQEFAAWLKSAGVDTSKLGIQPSAVSEAQVAGKSFAVVAGDILKQILGPNSQVTDAKVQSFIEAHPDLSTDPDALRKLLGWAREGLSFNREMALNGLQNVDIKTGMIPPGWQANYFANKKVFGPVFDWQQGELTRAPGAQPADKLPPAPTGVAPQPAATQYKEGQRATNPKTGQSLTFRNGAWAAQ